ncbi:MAG: type IV toxin-antitoxin system AbiEi family antitoxin domain-containing protein [Gordonibacter pamelaeae]
MEAIKKLNGISAYQKGLFTSRQAKRLGVERYVLSRLEKGGSVERVARGVYRMGGAPSLREEEVLAAWLSLDPGREPGAPTTQPAFPSQWERPRHGCSSSEKSALRRLSSARPRGSRRSATASRCGKGPSTTKTWSTRAASRPRRPRAPCST